MKVSYSDYSAFYSAFFLGKRTEGLFGGKKLIRYGGLRLGQAFVNKFFTMSMTDSELFNEEDPDKANQMITEKYLDASL